MSPEKLRTEQAEQAVLMQTAKPTRRGTKLFASAMLVAQTSAILRFIILARILGPEQLGLAALVILVGQFFDMSTDAGLDRYLIQDKQGNDEDALHCVHFISLIRALLVAAMMVAFAAPIANLFNAPELATAFMFFAIVPLFQGFLNYDFRRQQREHNFGSEGKALIASEILALAVTAVAAFITRDFTAVIYGLAARALALTVVSHWTSTRAYRIRLVREYIRPVFSFGWPLMINGLLLFAATQGDRLWIGKWLGPTELGHYSVIILLIFYPSAMLLRQISTIAMPWIAEIRDDRREANRRIDLLAGQVTLLTCLMIAGFAIVTPYAAPLLFGNEFAQPALLIALIGILQSIRFVRVWPTTIAIAAGRSGQVLVNNIIRLIGFPAAFLMFTYLPTLEGIVLGFIVGEYLSFVIAVLLANRAYRRVIKSDYLRMAFILGLCISVTIAAGSLVGYKLIIPATASVGAAIIIAFAFWIDRAAIQDANSLVRRALKLPVKSSDKPPREII